MPLLTIFPQATRWPRPLQWLVRLILGAFFTGASILLAAWLILQWGILPRAEQWKPELTRWASQSLGVQVQIAGIEVGGGMWSPMLTLRDLRLLDPQGRTALQLDRVRAVLAPRSLLPRSLVDWTPHFEQILIEAPQLEFRRDAQGVIWVAGIPLPREQSAPADRRGADWLFSQREVVVKNGDVRWIDEQRAAPPLHLQQVQLLLRNRITRHQWRLDAVPPPGWGESFTLRGDFRSSLLSVAGLQGPGDWQHWHGQAQIDAPLLDIEQLGAYITLPWSLQHGRARVSAWLDINAGALTRSSADVALRSVSLTTGPTAAPLELAWLKTRLAYERRHTRQGATLQLDLQQLQFETVAGVAWPRSDIRLALSQDSQGTLSGGGLDTSAVDLHRLAALADHLPLPRTWHQQLDSFEAGGQIEHLHLRWTGSPERWQRYEAQGAIKGLNLAAQAAATSDEATPAPAGRPGLRDADLTFEFTEQGGHLNATMHNGRVSLPGIFESTDIPITDLKTSLRWRRELREQKPPAYQVELQSLQIANADLQGQIQGRWQTGQGHGVGRGGYLPGRLDLKVRLGRADLAAVHRYLPLTIGKETRHYLRDALLAGRVTSLTAQVRGDLHDFPFTQAGSGDFKLRASVEQGRYAYVPPSLAPSAPWPVFTDLRTDVHIDQQRLTLHRGSARLGEVGSGQYRLSQVEGRVDDYLHDATLAIEGVGQGPLAEALHYVNASPIGGWIGHALANTRATGDASLQLALRIPLMHTADTTVRGTVQLPGNDLAFTVDTPLLAGTRGRVDFTEHGFSVSQGSTRTVGGNLSFEGGQQPDGSVRFTGTGLATADGLRRTPEMPWLADLARPMTGQATYRLQLGFVHGQPDVVITSPLNGLGLQLPAPLAKAEADTLPLRISVRPQSESNGSTIDLLRVELGKLLDAQYLRRHAPTGSTAPVQIVRGAIGLGQSPSWPDRGVSAQLSWPTLSVDDWAAWAKRSGSTGSASPAGKTPSGNGRGDNNAYLPTQLQISTNQLTVLKRQINQVRATVSRGPGSAAPKQDAWLIDIQAEQLAGKLELQGSGFGDGRAQGATPRDEDRILARLSRLSIPRDEAKALGDQLAQAEDDLPALDVVVDRFELHGNALGRMELQAGNLAVPRTGDARLWRIGKLLIDGPEAQLQASGQWLRRGGLVPSQTTVDFKLDIRDAGLLLARLGMVGAVRAGSGTLSGDVRWRGAPTAFEWDSLGGNVHLAVEKGQFLRADAGAAKLLGVLSLQSLPRRLLLDFRDITQSGFPFDRVEGDVSIERGVAATRLLQIKGLQALILTEGQADLVNETQDLQVWVVPEINAGAASLAYAVINPAVGLGTLLGQIFLRRPLAEAATRQFHVTGSWDAPVVAQIEHHVQPPSASAPHPPASADTTDDSAIRTP